MKTQATSTRRFQLAAVGIAAVTVWGLYLQAGRRLVTPAVETHVNTTVAAGLTEESPATSLQPQRRPLSLESHSGVGMPAAAWTPLSHVVGDEIELCQACEPSDMAACVGPKPIWGVDSASSFCGEPGWDSCGPLVDWDWFAQGEYIGPARTTHIKQYRFRVDDQIELVFTLTRNVAEGGYHLEIGDTMRTISLIPAREDEDGSTGLNLNIDNIEVQPDGTIVLPLLQPIRAVGLTIEELRRNVNKAYSKFYKQDPVWILPVRVNTRLQDLRDSVDARGGQGGQRINSRVSPDGTLQLPLLRTPVPAQGLTFAELKQEIDARYRDIVDGIEVTPVLSARAPRFVYVVGEVRQPGQIVLNQPTSVMMAISQAGGFNGLDANLRQVVVIRRGEDWRMMATILDVQGALYGRRPCPADDIWLRDSDVVVVPKSPLNIANEWIRQVFTRGIYSVVPQGATGIGINFSTSTSL